MARWESKLSRSFVLRDGRSLRTLAEARAFILKLPEADQQRSSWQSAVKQLLEGGRERRQHRAPTEAIERALFLQGKLKVR
jgi:hypothetical protein